MRRFSLKFAVASHVQAIAFGTLDTQSQRRVANRREPAAVGGRYITFKDGMTIWMKPQLAARDPAHHPVVDGDPAFH